MEFRGTSIKQYNKMNITGAIIRLSIYVILQYMINQTHAMLIQNYSSFNSTGYYLFCLIMQQAKSIFLCLS